MSVTQLLYDKRSQLVPNGLGIFSRATAQSAKDATVIDADGKEMIDFAGGIGVLNAGHCPAPVVAAIQSQAAKLIHTCFNVAIYEPYLALAQKLVDLFPHGEATKVLLTNSGAESVENAIKIARQATKRQAIICYEGGFHGRTMMAMTLTSKVGYKLNCGPYAPEVYRLPYPYFNQDVSFSDEAAFAQHHLQQLEHAFNTIVAADQVAAIIIEPVQGEGGFTVVSKLYLQGLRRICDEKGILLIIDEVQSGFGRTGKWAAYQHYEITPDLSTWAKSMGSGMPIGCVIGKAAIMDAAGPSTIGGTYPGNPVCAAAALATIEYMEDIDINEHGKRVANIVSNRFMQFKRKYPSRVKAVHGLGAMLAIELIKEGKPDAAGTKAILQYANENGLILINAGINGNCIRVLSPLVITNEQLNKGLDIIEQAIINLN